MDELFLSRSLKKFLMSFVIICLVKDSEMNIDITGWDEFRTAEQIKWVKEAFKLIDGLISIPFSKMEDASRDLIWSMNTKLVEVLSPKDPFLFSWRGFWDKRGLKLYE